MQNVGGAGDKAFALASGYCAVGNLQGAIDLCRQALQEQPGHAGAVQLLANLYGINTSASALGQVAQSLRQIAETQGFLALENLRSTPRNVEPKRLLRYGAKTYSQQDEDGIIAEIFRRIGTTNRVFLEIGCDNGRENNTLALLVQGWGGGWIEGDPANCRAIESFLVPELASGRLSLHEAWIDAESVESAIRATGVSGEIDLFSLDIDGNDLHVLGAISSISPRVIALEYNAFFPPPHDWTMPYDPKHVWDRSFAIGASLTAFHRLLSRRGYGLVGCTANGGNAFFVREDCLGDHFAAPFTPENHYEPPRPWVTATFANTYPVVLRYPDRDRPKGAR